MTLANNSIYPYHTGDGSPILENSVIGVKKHLGPWAFPNGANCLQTGEIMKIDFADINEAVSYINMYAPSNCGMKPLSCDAQTSPIPTTGAELEENIDLDDFFDLDTIVWF